jgi:hypothetical protein
MKSLKFLLPLIMLIFVKEGFAQNARFSQMTTAPIQFNPSLTGRFDGLVRSSNLFSWQRAGKAEVSHQNFSVDFKLGNFRSSGDDDTTTTANTPTKDESVEDTKKMNGYWGFGVNYYHYGGKICPINASFFSISAARHFYNKSNKFYGFGLQMTHASGKLDEVARGTIYDKEISGGGFHYPTQTGSTIYNRKYFDFNIGAYYGMVSDLVMFELGGSMGHLFYPCNMISGPDADKPNLRHRISANSLLRLKLNEKWGLVQKNIYWKEGLYYRSSNKKDSLEIVAFWVGAECYKIDPTSKYNVNFGFYTRSFTTMMPVLRINLTNYIDFRYSYEFPINSKKFPAYSAKRNEIGLILSYKRNSSVGSNFYKKINYW